MQVRARRRILRLPAGESALTRLTRVKGLLAQFQDGKQPSRALVIKCLKEYSVLLGSLWSWGLTKK